MRNWFWWEDAACRTADADLFHPEGATKEQRRAAERKAKRICWRCSVRNECLEAALEQDESHGIWGGLSARERKRRYAKTA